MTWRLLKLATKTHFPSQTLTPCLFHLSPPIQNPNPNFLTPLFSQFSTSFINLKKSKKNRKRRKKKESPRTKLIQHESQRIQFFEEIVQRDTFFRFITKTKEFLSKQPQQILLLDDAGKLYRELGFPRGRKVSRSIERHPALLQVYRHTDNKFWIGFTETMEKLLEQERQIMDAMEESRVRTVRKLLMMSTNHRIPLSKIYHCRLLFGIPEDFRDRIAQYPDYFRVTVENDGKRILELVDWDPALAVSALQRDFIVDEDRVKKAFQFPIRRGRYLDLDEDDERKVNMLNTLPLVSPYSDCSGLDLWSLEAEKYRIGVLHEFLSLTLEKRASIHHIVEFKEEFSLTKHTYQMLSKQPQSFYLAGTEMNWTVFLRDAYDANGVLMEMDPQVGFNEKLYRYACLKEGESDVVGN